MTANEDMERFKLVIAGDGACGKTSLLTVFKMGTFPTDHLPTVFETTSANLTVDGKVYELTLWDTAGQEEYDRLRPLSYQKADVVLVCFSIDSPDSMANVELKWAKEVKHFCKNVPMILVANKIDIRTDQELLKELETDHIEPIKTEKTEKVAKSIGATAFIETSAKTKENLQILFETAAREASKGKKQRNQNLKINCINCVII